MSLYFAWGDEIDVPGGVVRHYGVAFGNWFVGFAHRVDDNEEPITDFHEED